MMRNRYVPNIYNQPGPQPAYHGGEQIEEGDSKIPKFESIEWIKQNMDKFQAQDQKQKNIMLGKLMYRAILNTNIISNEKYRKLVVGFLINTDSFSLKEIL